MTMTESMHGVERDERTRVLYGPGTTASLGALALELGATRVFLVTDEGLVAAGHVKLAEQSLTTSGLQVSRFSDVSANPTDRDMERCRQAAEGFEPDLFVGFGGGSSIDMAKGANLLLACGGEMRDYWGDGKATADLLPLIAVPTTAGTGTEVQRFTLVSDAVTHQKFACGDARLTPCVALLDPALTVSVPRHVTACTGLDAIGHALETAVTTARNERSSAYARAAFLLACSSFGCVLREPTNIDARGDMLRMASLAGLAIEHSMLGAAHALANPLTARFDVVHGHAVALMLPAVVRHNAGDPTAAAIYAGLARDGGLCPPEAQTEAACEALAAHLHSLLIEAELPTTLEACGVSARDCEGLAQDASEQWTAAFNPRAVGTPELERMYRATLPGGAPG